MRNRPEETTGHLSHREKRKPSLNLSTIVYGKIPPQAKELEEAVLGAILLITGAFDIAAEIVRAECFYVDAHQKIFTACQNLQNNQHPIDMLTVIEALKATEELDMVGGPYALTKLTNNVVSAANIATHCRLILDKFMRRELIRLSGETIGAAYEDSADVFDLLDEHEKTLGLITTGNIKNDFQTTLALGAKEVERVEHLMANPTDLTGITTGYKILNTITSGWQPTDLIILAGRPSVGKTCLALNFLRNAARGNWETIDGEWVQTKPGIPVGFFSLEMSASQLERRLICAESMVYLDKFNTGKLTEKDYKEFLIAQQRIAEMPIFIDDSAGINIYELRSKARRMVAKHGVKFIILDYLQLMSGDDKSHNREQEISTISRKLKGLAKELNVPFMALSQMSRDIEKRKGEPQLSDLRESGAIEQDADLVMFGTRDDYQGAANSEGEVSNTAYLKIAKHRNGPLDKLIFKTDLRIQTWFDAEQWERMNRWAFTEKMDGQGWKPVNDAQDSSRLFIQKGSRMASDEWDDTTTPAGSW